MVEPAAKCFVHVLHLPGTYWIVKRTTAAPNRMFEKNDRLLVHPSARLLKLRMAQDRRSTVVTSMGPVRENTWLQQSNALPCTA